MNIEIFELKYLEFIFSSVWNYLGFIVILLIVTNFLRKVFTPIKNFATNVKERYRKLSSGDKIADKLKALKPDKILQNQE